MNHWPECDSPREACGVFGAFGLTSVARVVYQGLFSLQHRGQESAGIAVSDGTNVRCHKELGLVNEVFSKRVAANLPGHLGIGHVRYSTTGSPVPQNIQPIVVECVDGVWCIAHNGNLTNASELRRMYQESGAIFQTTTDSETLIHLLADPMYRLRPRRVARALAELRGAFSFLVMTKDCLMASRDPLGFKPLSIGRLGNGHVFASETCALRQVGAEYIRDVEPGELVVADETGLHTSRFAEPSKDLSQCVFEHVYFARPDSVVFGESAHRVRCALGRRLAQEHPVEADIVIPVPDSGNEAALGFSWESGIRLDSGFIRSHYVGRTFIMPGADQRAASVDMKLAVVDEVVKDKRVVVVDDSIIRGTTAKRRVKALREAGAKEIHMRISSPPTVHPCFFGIDFPTKEELIAASSDVDAIRRHLAVDGLGYLSIEGLLSPFKEPGNFCTACFSGKYPMDVAHMKDKKALESLCPTLQFEG